MYQILIERSCDSGANPYDKNLWKVENPSTCSLYKTKREALAAIFELCCSQQYVGAVMLTKNGRTLLLCNHLYPDHL